MIDTFCPALDQLMEYERLPKINSADCVSLRAFGFCADGSAEECIQVCEFSRPERGKGEFGPLHEAVGESEALPIRIHVGEARVYRSFDSLNRLFQKGGRNLIVRIQKQNPLSTGAEHAKVLEHLRLIS